MEFILDSAVHNNQLPPDRWEPWVAIKPRADPSLRFTSLGLIVQEDGKKPGRWEMDGGWGGAPLEPSQERVSFWLQITGEKWRDSWQEALEPSVSSFSTPPSLKNPCRITCGGSENVQGGGYSHYIKQLCSADAALSLYVWWCLVTGKWCSL